ncbi:MAG: transketolase family protein [Oscillospiraceae bacterium]|nr:transketolase family protein [Oscillospiraceae bacterium]
MSKTIREAYGESLLKYGKDDPRVVVLDADVSTSTRSLVFAKGCPERFFNMGIAEANMVGAAGGMAACGKIVFVNSFAVFLSTLGLLSARAFGSYSGLNLKFMGAYGGLSDAYDGPSHHSVEDLAIMRALPHFKVFVATDEHQVDWLVKTAIDTDGPVYIRLSRDSLPEVYSKDTKFEIGKGQILREGKDLTILACGVMVGQALKAGEMLAAQGISARVVDLFTIKPIDRPLILESAEKTGLMVSAEEHSVIGGLGGAVAEVLAKAGSPAKLACVGLEDTHAETGAYPQLLKKYKLDADAIVAQALGGLQK